MRGGRGGGGGRGQEHRGWLRPLPRPSHGAALAAPDSSRGPPHATAPPHALSLLAITSTQVLVHPVPPVLNETRHIVKLFNAQLRAKVQKEPTLTWLDFFDGLLSADGERLADGLSLDGTHMHPDYVRLLEAALPA